MNRDNTHMDGCVALHGSYGNGNFGDWLLLRILVDEIQRCLPRARVVLPMGSDLDLKQTGAHLSGLRAAATASHLVYGGGGYFGAPSKGELRWSLRNSLRHVPPWLVLGRGRLIPHVASGIGVGPLRGRISRSVLGAVLRSAQRVTVRDEESADWSRDIGVSTDRISLGCDWALALAEPQIELATPNNRDADEPLTLHVSRAILGSEVGEGIVRSLVSELRQRGEKRWVVLSDNLADNALLDPERLSSLGLTPKNIVESVPFVGVDQTLARLRRVRAVVTGKLHVGVTSACFGARVFSLAGHPKIMRFYTQLGLSDACVEVWTGDLDRKTVVERAIRQLIGEDAQGVRERTHALSARLDVNRQDLHSFLRGS